MAPVGKPALAVQPTLPHPWNTTIKQEPPSSDSDIEEEEYVTPDIYGTPIPACVSARVKKEERSPSPKETSPVVSDAEFEDHELDHGQGSNDKKSSHEGTIAGNPADIPLQVCLEERTQSNTSWDMEEDRGQNGSEQEEPAERVTKQQDGNIEERKKKRSTKKLHQCLYCPYSTESASTLRDHQCSHTGQRPYCCPVCGKTFARRRYLRVHSRVHQGPRGTDGTPKDSTKHDDGQSHVCNVCGDVFDRSGQLTKHMRSHGEHERTYECPQCRKSYKYVGNLRTHLRTHTGERPYMCDVCGLRFTCSSYLQVHLRTHVQHKPYVCSECGKSFVHNSALNVHMRSHTGEQPYKCSHCNLRFSHLRNMKRHEICIHTRQYPHNCDVCHKGFLVITHWRQHMVTHHSASE